MKAIKIQLIAILFISSLVLKAQEEKSSVRKIMFPGETHHFYVMERSVSVELNNAVDYYWFKNNAIHHSKGDYAGALIHGLYIIYYTNNDLKEKGHYDRGRKTGEWKSWNEDGSLREVSNWKLGLQHGTIYQYNEYGDIQFQGNYRKGQKHGEFIYQDLEGNTLKERYKRGKLSISKAKTVKEKQPKIDKPAKAAKKTKKKKETAVEMPVEAAAPVVTP